MNYKKIYYWSPSFVNIATNRAVINSAYSVSKYNHEFNSSIINFFGEFTKFKKELNDKKVVCYSLIVTIFSFITPTAFPFIFIPKKALFFDLDKISVLENS